MCLTSTYELINMNPLNEFISDLYQIIIGQIPTDDDTLIKMHTRYLEELGDVSFPISMKNWCRFIKEAKNKGSNFIFSYKMSEHNIDSALQTIIAKSNDFGAKLQAYKVIKTSAHLFLERPSLFKCGIQKVLADDYLYGKWTLFSKSIQLALIDNEIISNLANADLTILRLHILKSTLENLLKLTVDRDSKDTLQVSMSQNMKPEDFGSHILCGPVLNEKGIKDVEHKALDIFDKRISDMRMMAQHRYRVNVKSATEWSNLFSRLGKASVAIELLSNKPQKPVKISLNNLSGTNKGPAFIFYNCARLSILLKEFDNKVNRNIYPCLPKLDEINFTLLNQPEEWELLYVYILQFPHTIKNCIRSIDKGIVNPQHLITFLSNLSSVFSVYYRRVRILTDPRDHMFATIHLRIYLLKALQCVFHNALKILNIEPVQEMYI